MRIGCTRGPCRSLGFRLCGILPLSDAWEKFIGQRSNTLRNLLKLHCFETVGSSSVLFNLAAEDSAGILVALCLSAFTAGLARGFAGFGAGLIFMPLASSAIGAAVAAPILLLVDLVMSAPMVVRAWEGFDRRDVSLMVAGSLAGVPLGSFVLAHADPIAMRWGIVAVIGSLLALLISGWRYQGRPAAPLTVAVGSTAGFLSGLAQVGGPPVLAYWLGGAIPPAKVRANLIFFFGVASMATAVAYTAGGLLTGRVLMLSLIAGPSYGVGLLIGSRLFGVASEETFRRACFALIAAAAVISMPVLDSWLGRGG